MEVVRTELKPGRNLVRDWIRDMEDPYLLEYSHGLLSLFSYSNQDYEPRGGTVRSELGPRTSIKKMLHEPFW